MEFSLKTCRFQVSGLSHFLETAKKEKCILVFWHNRLSPLAGIIKRYAPLFDYGALISKSQDGDLLAYLTESYPQGKAIRVPHHSKHRGLLSLIQTLKEGKRVLLITPDGPRGPRYLVKPGVILAAKETQAKLVPFTWTATRLWEFNTWDKFRIPKPFSKISVHFGEPIQVLSSDSLQEKMMTLEEALNRLEV